MSVSRTVFELAVPCLVKHGVTPLAYLGDALLAVAEGPAHRDRAIAFAQDYVARTQRLGTLRARTDEPWPLAMRAGIASGPVVLGVLGNVLKEEFTAIGRTVNLAARLQAQAQPSGLVVELESQPGRTSMDVVPLKGFGDTPIPIERLTAPPTLSLPPSRP